VISLMMHGNRPSVGKLLDKASTGDQCVTFSGPPDLKAKECIILIVFFLVLFAPMYCFACYFKTGMFPWEIPYPSSPQFQAAGIRAVEAIKAYHFQPGQPTPSLNEMKSFAQVARSGLEDNLFLFIEKEFLVVASKDPESDFLRGPCADGLISVIKTGKVYFPQGFYKGIPSCAYVEFSEYNPWYLDNHRAHEDY
jgi:hypothetical protein